MSHYRVDRIAPATAAREGANVKTWTSQRLPRNLQSRTGGAKQNGTMSGAKAACEQIWSQYSLR